MKWYYIQRYDEDTDSVDMYDLYEEKLSVKLEILSELAKKYKICGFNQITGKIKVLTKEEFVGMINSKFMLLQREDLTLKGSSGIVAMRSKVECIGETLYITLSDIEEYKGIIEKYYIVWENLFTHILNITPPKNVVITYDFKYCRYLVATDGKNIMHRQSILSPPELRFTFNLEEMISIDGMFAYGRVLEYRVGVSTSSDGKVHFDGRNTFEEVCKKHLDFSKYNMSNLKSMKYAFSNAKSVIIPPNLPNNIHTTSNVFEQGNIDFNLGHNRILFDSTLKNLKWLKENTVFERELNKSGYIEGNLSDVIVYRQKYGDFVDDFIFHKLIVDGDLSEFRGVLKAYNSTISIADGYIHSFKDKRIKKCINLCYEEATKYGNLIEDLEKKYNSDKVVGLSTDVVRKIFNCLDEEDRKYFKEHSFKYIANNGTTGYLMLSLSRQNPEESESLKELVVYCLLTMVLNIDEKEYDTVAVTINYRHTDTWGDLIGF